DARWATRGAGLQDDDDAPGWDGDDQIVFTPQTIDEAATSSNIFLLQGVAMVRAYGRFYAGGDITDDAMDAAAPYYFARSLGPAIDRARIGAYGGSWGGFMVVYGAALAPDETVPRTAVALAPPSDFADMWRWAATDLPALYPDPDEATRFFSPYLRRIEAAAGGPPATGDYTPFSWRAVCDGLRGPLLVPHDEWDVLVTVRQTEGLIAACPDRVTPLYWHRQAPTDYATVGMSHGPFDGAEGFSMTLSLPLTHLLLELIEGRDVVTVIDDAPLAGFLQTLRDEQLAGGDPVEALPRLRELADPRVLALASDGTTRSGAEVLATGWNSVYGTAFDADGIRAALVAGLPSP
ncbi:MAG: hypothetical protein KC619_22435, partial [Myxococcales bacterium]|nr:hypothetical protein [Myxococcales bacterium]